MPDQISTQRFKKRALERWENEGGRVYLDLDAIENRTPPSKQNGTDRKPGHAQGDH